MEIYGLHLVRKTLSGLIFVVMSTLTESKKCEDPRYRKESIEMRDWPVVDTSKLPPSYICPRSHDPETLTECCWDGGCCPKYMPAMYQVDEWLIMVTAITVIISCMLLTVIVIVCCFWSRCPFYNTCRVNYTPSDIVIYTMAQDDDPLASMPLENSNSRQYKPNIVKVKQVEEV